MHPCGWFPSARSDAQCPFSCGRLSFDGGQEEFRRIRGDFRGGRGGMGADRRRRRRPFLFYVHPSDSSRLKIQASDFHSLTWERTLTVYELEDLRDDIGIGGSWSEFVDYLAASLSSGDAKLILGGVLDVTGSDASWAKLVARKSKGLPRISLPLNRLMDSFANDAMSNLSLALFRTFKSKHEDTVKEQLHLQRLKGILSSERERSESLQKQLDSLSFLSKRKGLKLKVSDAESPASDTINNYATTLVSEIQQPSEISTKYSQSLKINRRAAPASRRAKVRGVSLKDASDTDDT